jgi:proline iminopeptidase
MCEQHHDEFPAKYNRRQRINNNGSTQPWRPFERIHTGPNTGLGLRQSDAWVLFAAMLRLVSVVLLSLVGLSTHAAESWLAPEGATVMVNGAKLWYRTEGRGEPLLLVEGGPGSAGYLDPFFKELSDQFTVIHFRGLGRTGSDRAASPTDYTFDRDVADLEGFRVALGLGSVNLLGHSYGGMVVTAYALQHPQAVRRLVIANGVLSAASWQAGNENVLSTIRYQYPEVWEKLTALRARGLRSSAPECRALLGSVSEAIFYVASVNYVGRTPGEMNPEVCYAIAGDDADFQVGGSIAGRDYVPRLKELTMPVLITTSRFDRVVPPLHTFTYRSAAPQAEFVIFEQSGHNLFLEESAKFIATLRTFLNRPLP